MSFFGVAFCDWLPHGVAEKPGTRCLQAMNDETINSYKVNNTK
jgi:hypothetical protein